MANWVRLWLVLAVALWGFSLSQTPKSWEPIMISVATSTPAPQTITDTVRIMFGPNPVSIAYAMKIASRESGPDFTQVIGDHGRSI